MNRFLLYGLLTLILGLSACTRVVTVGNPRPNYPHDNGKHKGCYKNGRGLPPGQAKQRGW